MLSMMLVRTDPVLERILENRTIRDAAAPVHETTDGLGSLISALSIISSNYKVRLQSRAEFSPNSIHRRSPRSETRQNISSRV